MTVGPIVIESAKGPRFWPMGTRLRRMVEVNVCSRDFHREAIVFLVIDCRGPDRGRRLFVFATTAEELFSAGGITGFNETV
jgi:hypothetical protein